MMPMLESLANTVSALPTAASASPSFSGASGSGGFAAVLAAAQEQSATPQSSRNGQGSDLSDSNGPASGTTNATLGFANNFNARGAASGTAQLRKSTGNSASNNSLAVALAGAVVVTSPLPQPVAMTAVPLTPAIVPAISIATAAPTSVAPAQPNVSLPNLLQANELPASFLQTSSQQSLPEQSGALPSSGLQPGLPQPSFPASPTSVTNPAQAPAAAAGSIQPTLAANGFGAATAGTAVPNASALNPSPGSASLSSAIPSLSSSGIFNATGMSAESDGQEASGKTATATVNVTAPATTSNPVPASPNTTASWNGLQNNWGAAEPVVLAENTLPSQLSSTFGQSASSTLSSQNQTVNVTTPSPNLLANALPEPVPQQGLPSSANADQLGEASASGDGAQSNVTSSFPVSATAAPVPDVSTPSTQAPSAAVLNLAAQMLASKAPLPAAASVPAPQSTTAPNSAPVRAAAGHQS